MCWWGIYQAESFRAPAPALKTPRQSKKLSKHATEPEKLLHQSRRPKRKPCTETRQARRRKRPAKDSKETKTLTQAVALSPNDTQAKSFLAESVLSGRKRRPQTRNRRRPVAHTQILVEHPNDSAANHYWIHAAEPANHPELAVDSARNQGSLAPASGHMVHMPGHIFYRTGDYETARVSFGVHEHRRSLHARPAHHRRRLELCPQHDVLHRRPARRRPHGPARQFHQTGHTARGDTVRHFHLQYPRHGLTCLNVAPPRNSCTAIGLQSHHHARSQQARCLTHQPRSIRAALLEYTRAWPPLRSQPPRRSLHTPRRPQRLSNPGPTKNLAGFGMPMPGTPSKDLQKNPAHTFMDVAALELQGALLTAQNKSTEADAAFKKAADAGDPSSVTTSRSYYIRPCRRDPAATPCSAPAATPKPAPGLRGRPQRAARTPASCSTASPAPTPQPKRGRSRHRSLLSASIAPLAARRSGPCRSFATPMP